MTTPALQFLSGTIPAKATFNIKQFFLLHMLITLVTVNPLHWIAIYNLSYPPPQSQRISP